MRKRKDPPIPQARNKKLLAILKDMQKQGLLPVDENGVWTVTEAGVARLRISSLS